MGQATRRKFAALLLMAGATAGCSSMSGSSLTAWMPWPKKQEQGLAWTTPDVSKTYGKNQIAAERGGAIEPRTEMPKPPQEEGRVARMTSFVTKPVKSVASVFKRSDKASTAAETVPELADSKKSGGAAIFVNLAQVQEKQGNIKAAIDAYERALAADSSNLEALLGYARLQDRQGDFPKATQLYQAASRLHPKEASVHNDLGLCLTRQGKTAEAREALTRAVQLRPDRKLYRNNLAKLLIDSGQPQQALDQLLAAHPPANAHYNLGYLLHQKNEPMLARHHFARALELDPALADARQWLAMLDGPHMAEAPARPDAQQGAYHPANNSTPMPVTLPVYPQPQQRTSMDTEFYLPSRY